METSAICSTRGRARQLCKISRISAYRSTVTGTYLLNFSAIRVVRNRISIRFVERFQYRILASISRWHPPHSNENFVHLRRVPTPRFHHVDKLFRRVRFFDVAWNARTVKSRSRCKFRKRKYVDYWHSILPKANISGAGNEKNLGKRSIDSGQISRTSWASLIEIGPTRRRVQPGLLNREI